MKNLPQQSQWIKGNILTPQESNALEKIIDEGRVENTEKTYINSMRQLQKCGFTIPVTSQSLIKFFLMLKDRGNKASTISTYINIIAKSQTDMGFSNPISKKLEDALSAYRKTTPSKNLKGARLYESEIIHVAKTLYNDKSEKGIRNRILFLCALWTAGRTDEISRFDFRYIELNEASIVFNVFGAKNFKGEMLIKEVPKLSTPDNEMLTHLCLWDAYYSYKGLITDDANPLIRRLTKSGKISTKGISERSIGNVIKAMLIECGITIERVSKINGHSFRHTLADIGSQLGLSSQALQKLGGWKKIDTITNYVGEHRNSSIQAIAEKLTRKP